MLMTSTIVCSASFIVVCSYLLLARFSVRAREQLDSLTALNQREAFTTSSIDWRNGALLLSGLNSRLGKAGFFTRAQRSSAGRLLTFSALLSGAVGGLLGYVYGDLTCIVAGVGCGLYLAGLGILHYLNWRSRVLQRQVLFDLPILLESIILLVESGLGVLPALGEVVQSSERWQSAAHTYLAMAYDLTQGGMPFSNALDSVASSVDSPVVRHVFLHLEVSSNEGGELIPSLRSLGDFCQEQWRLSVDARVRRLENLVVFPVFGAVIGLLLLTSAVPLVPILEFAQNLESRPMSVKTASSQAAEL